MVILNFELTKVTSKSFSIVILSFECTLQQTLGWTPNKLNIYGTFEHANEKKNQQNRNKCSQLTTK